MKLSWLQGLLLLFLHSDTSLCQEYGSESGLRTSRHTNNWAVLVSTSRFWFNYRHMANVLSFYRTVKRLGIPDDQIIIMLSDDVACNARNPFPGAVYNQHNHKLDLYGNNIEVDFRGYEVNVENFIRLLTDRWDEDMPRSKRLNTDDRSNILVYLTGHGGNDFLKFQDAEEIGAWDIAAAFGQMWEKRRYNEILFMIDTCEANSMYSKIFSPNIIAVGSSRVQESSYANETDSEVGVSLIDRFTSINLEYLEKVSKTSELTLADFFGMYDPKDIGSHPGIRTDLFPDALDRVKITDFFGNIQNVGVDGVPTTAIQKFRWGLANWTPSLRPNNKKGGNGLAERTKGADTQTQEKVRSSAGSDSFLGAYIALALAALGLVSTTYI